MSASPCHFRFNAIYTPAPGHSLRFHFGGSPTGETTNPVPLARGHVLGWSSFSTYTQSDAIKWSQLKPRSVTLGLGWRESGPQSRRPSASLRLPFAPLARRENSLQTLWNIAQVRNSTKIIAKWNALLRRDQAARESPWTEPHHRLQATLLLPWSAPPAKEPGRALPWGHLLEFSSLSQHDWRNPPARQRPLVCAWGPLAYERECYQRYQPPQAGQMIVLDLSLSLSLVGDKDHISLFFEQYIYDRNCTQRPPSGWRDAYYYQQGPPVPTAQSRRYHHVLNTVLLTRLPDRAPIEALELRLHTDMAAFCWQLQARLASSAGLNLLRGPEGSGEPLLLEVSLNGWEWIFSLDTWSENRTFSSSERRISGRSRSAALAAPAGLAISLNPQQELRARQLAQAALDAARIEENVDTPIDWQLDWRLADWLIPACVYSCAGVSAMQVLREIAEAAHGVTQSHADKDKLLILPRYCRPPWEWSLALADMIVPESMVFAMEAKRDPRPQYNAAFVSGRTEGGISAKVTRAGTAGERSGPMFSHSLITDTDVATARGLGMLAASGEWHVYRIALPLFPQGDRPGLLLPGTLLGVSSLRGSGWAGQVIGTTLHATLTRHGVLLRQILEVERYCGSL